MENVNGFSQEHISFMGISLGTNVSDFKSQLIDKGFTLIMDDAPTGTGMMFAMKGYFAGKPSEITACFSEKIAKIYMIIIDWGGQYNSWFSIKSDYNGIKKSFIAKYGEPFVDFHDFDSPYYEGDGCEMAALSNEKCDYSCRFGANGGDVMLSMSTQHTIRILYRDSCNMKIHRAEVDNLIISEI